MSKIVLRNASINTNISSREFTPLDLFRGGEQGAWYDPSDLSTLFRDAAGTIPVTALGQPVGLVLDKSRNSVGTNGARRVNLLFSTQGFAWNNLFRVSITNGAATAPDGTMTGSRLTCTQTGSEIYLRQNTAFAANTSYTISIYAKADTASWLRLRNLAIDAGAWFNLTTGTVGTVAPQLTASMEAVGNGWYRCVIVGTTASSIANNLLDVAIASADLAVNCIQGNSILIWGADARLTANAAVAPIYQRIDANWPDTMAGTHLVQTSNAARPTVQARVNLLTRTEEFSDAVWAKTNITVTNTSETAPDGTTTADKLVATAVSGNHFAAQSVSVVAGQSYRVSVVAKPAEYSRVQFGRSNPGLVGFSLVVDVSTGSIVSQSLVSGVEVVGVGNGWYRISFTALADTTGTSGIAAFVQNASGQLSYTGDGVSGLLLWGADFRPAADTTFPYQRVTTATDYADVGAPRYLQFDGVDDWMVTSANLDLTSTDKVSIFSGVRKTGVIGGNGVLYEFSSNWNNENGKFGLFVEDGTIRYIAAARGTAPAAINQFAGTTSTVFNTPVTNVLTALHDIVDDLNRLRINGLLVGIGTGDQGAGNFGSHLLYVGSRGGSLFPFNGYLHQLIIRGRLTTDAALFATERFVGQKTGIVI